MREGHVKAYDLLALVHHREKNYAEEKQVLETVSELSPDNPERNINLGLASANTGDHGSVKKYLKEDMAVYYFNLAVTYTERSRGASGPEKLEGFKTAEKFVNKAIDCDPEHKDSRKLYAWLDEHIN
nr:hypothetical protein [Desulfobulbaceae bacterium]